MKAQTRFAFVGLLVLIALITSIALPMTAFADEAPTPPPSSDSSGAAQPAQGADTSAPAQPADTAAPTDPPSATDAAAQSTDAPAATQDPATAVASDTPAPTDTTKDTNSPAATDTPVVVLNSDGTVEPLATQEAANIIATGDPMWCPGSSTPGNAGCTGATTVTDLITAIGSGGKTGPGTIYFESTYATDDATFDHSDSKLAGLTALIIQGGWNGDSTVSGYALLSSGSTFSVPLSVINWTDDVTINDITINNTDATGLYVATTGNISLNNVKSNHNITGAGAYLDNCNDTGGGCTGNGSINVSSGTFNSNDTTGLFAKSTGDITLTNVIANGNGFLYGNDGAYLDNTSGTGNIEVDNSFFGDTSLDGNKGDGLSARSKGTITLMDVTANYNYLGAYLYNSDGTGIIVNGSSNTFNNNDNVGLWGRSNGDIILMNISANDNLNSGAYLDNSDGTGSITINGSSNTFNGNLGYNGLTAESLGDISLDQVTANGNASNGAALNNCYYLGLGCTGVGNISVSNSIFGDSSFENGNGGNGLRVVSHGNVTLSAVTADSNSENGALLGYVDPGDNYFSEIGGTVTVTGGDFSGNGREAYLSNSAGLGAYADGAIILTGVTANENYVSGAYLDNCVYTESDGCIGAGDITISGSSNTFNENGLCGSDCFEPQYGLDAYSNGQIALTNVAANDNFMAGAYLENSRSDSGSINVSSSNFNYNGNCGFFCEAFLDGLDALSTGDITLTDVTGNGNFDDGAYLDNSYGSGNIEIGNSTFGDPSGENGNGNSGLEAYSNGNITLNNTDAIGNYDDGTYIETPGAVIVNCGHYNNNKGDAGIVDKRSASLTLNGVELSGNSAPYLYGGIAVIGTNCNGSSGGSNGGGQTEGATLPIHTIDVTGGEANGLNCTQYGGTQLILPNNDSALFPCPISDSASLGSLTTDKLPGTLPKGDTFVSAFTTSVIKNGASSSPVESPITVSFSVPDSMKNAKLAILYWDGSKWVEVSGHMTADGHFETTTDLTGTFVLVSK